MKYKFNVSNNFLCNVDVENISSHKLYRDNGDEFLGVGIEIYADLYINVDEANKYIVTIKSNERFSITNDKVKLHNVKFVNFGNQELIQSKRGNNFKFKITIDKIEIL